ncbi:hypothetical protein CMUS01_09416 [Colletotrichum musicola]|uniref:Uncharacterized protein n=1 Tax=Colletotrichum musicola TaxID=2175873 RepID=A0A8H6NB89_9PEZI|nr:hypothetical protein CMUS01_09416 [Colletotrichum musicola]
MQKPKHLAGPGFKLINWEAVNHRGHASLVATLMAPVGESEEERRSRKRKKGKKSQLTQDLGSFHSEMMFSQGHNTLSTTGTRAEARPSSTPTVSRTDEHREMLVLLTIRSMGATLAGARPGRSVVAPSPKRLLLNPSILIASESGREKATTGWRMSKHIESKKLNGTLSTTDHDSFTRNARVPRRLQPFCDSRRAPLSPFKNGPLWMTQSIEHWTLVIPASPGDDR